MKEKTNRGSIAHGLAYLWVAAVFTVLTFYVDDGYFNIVEAKAYCYNILALLFITVFLCVGLGSLLDVKFRGAAHNFWKTFHFLDGAVAAFGLAALLSVLNAETWEAAFWGSEGWSVGGYAIISLCVLYFFISRSLKHTKGLLLLMLLSGIAVFILGISNSLHMDPLGLHNGLLPEDYYRYTATIGNVNWYVGYLSMLLPIVMYASSLIAGKKTKALCYVFLFLGGINCFTCNCDGIYLGMGTAVIILLFVSLKEKKQFEEVLQQGILFCLAAGAVKILRESGREFVPIEGMSAVFLDTYLWLLAGALCLILLFVVRKQQEKRFVKAGQWMKIILGVATLIIFVIIIGVTVMNFNDDWGHRRGYIWKSGIEIFRSLPWNQKIFGCGADSFGILYEALKGSDWIRNAHNEYLQYLVTTGIGGLAGYIGIYVACIAANIRKKKKSDEKTAVLLGIMGYGGQALVNNPQALNMAVFFLLLSYYRYLEKRQNERKEEL